MIANRIRRSILPISEISESLPEVGLIYEIGSGIGVLAHALATESKGRQVVGIDSNQNKIQLAKKSFSLENLKFIRGDAKSYSYKPCAGIVMSDFLHHISHTEQLNILNKVTQRLKPRGILVVKEIARDDGVFMWLSRLWDLALYPQDRIYYRTRNEWLAVFKNTGLEVRVRRATHWFPGSTHLFTCQKA